MTLSIRRSPIILVAILLAGPFARDANARAGRLEVGISPIYAYLVLESRDEPKGFGGGAQLRYGLSDTFALVATGLWTVHSIEVSEGDAAFHVMAGDIGLAYTLDVVRFLPRLEASIGAIHRRFQGAYQTDLGVRLGLSVDYRLSKRWMVGFGLSYHGFVTDLANVPIYVELGPRLIWCWEL